MIKASEIFMTPVGNYTVEKLKRKEWLVSRHDVQIPLGKVTRDEAHALGTYPSKIVALASITIDVDTQTQRTKKDG